MRSSGILLFSALCAFPATAMTISSRELTNGRPMPAANIYPRCGGKNVSPQLAWSGAPPATESYVLTMIDQDVTPSKWSHWIIVGLPRATQSLPSNLHRLPRGAHTVVSNFGPELYSGPCPPKGSGVHHYMITVWAMGRRVPRIGPDVAATSVEALLRRSSLARASLTATVSG